MTTAAFLLDLRRRGVSLRVEDGALALRAPRGVLTEADRDRLQAEKAAILSELTATDEQPFPLTDIQQAYLVGRAAELDLGQVGCHAYREFECANLDLPRLQTAWNRLVRRHPMLHAVFTSDGKQRVLPTVPDYAIDVLDLCDSPDADATLAALREERSHRLFDPATWPLFEIHATLLRTRVRLSVGIDLLIADAAALITLFREWGALYADPDRALPPPEGRFAAHVRMLQPASPADRAYWEARFDTLPPGPSLPLLPASGAPRFSRRVVRLEATRWRGVKQAAALRGLTASALLAAVYTDSLAAYSRHARFSLTLTQFAAPPGMRGVVGDFTATVLLEADTSAPCFADRAAALQRRLLADLDHAGLSGVAVLREVRRRRPDVVPVSVVFTSTLGHPGLDPDAPSPLAWLGETVHAITQTPQVAMDHHVLEEAGALIAGWDVVEALFPPGMLDGMIRHYTDLLQALADGAGWDRRVGTPRSAAMQAGPAAEPLHATFERAAWEHPERPAVIASDRVLDYGTLDRAATRLAALIAGELREASDPLVAIEQPKGWRQVLAVLAVLKAGAAYLPVDPALPAERRRALISRGEAMTLDPAWIDAALSGPVPALPPFTDPSRLAYVIYTSGSTGEPKGVMIEHRAAVTTVHEINRRWRITAEDRVLGLSSLSFDLSVWDIFGPLGAGGALVLPPPEASRDPAAWAALLLRHRVTVWNSVPALMAMQVEHGLPAGHALRLMLLSGDWVPLPLADALRRAAPETVLVALGGATEAAIWSNAHEIGDLDPAWTSVPYGRPLAGQMLHVVNQRGEDCPDWVTGEIEISGAGLARGYWRNAERTAERFVTNQMTGERRYRTGDLGRFRPYADDGNHVGGTPPAIIEFLGREDFQVKVQGHRIELGEIETVLTRHPDVTQAVVVALPSGADKALHAFVVPHREAWDRARFLLERHGLRRLPDQPRIALPNRPPPKAYDHRRSVRRFAPDPAPFAALAEVLAETGATLVARLIAVRVDGLGPGLWQRDADKLRRIGDAPSWHVPDAGTARVSADAAFLIILDAGTADRDALLAAGAAAQRMMRAAQSLDLGLCPIGVLHLEGRPVLHALAGGIPAAEVAGFDLAGALREHCGALLPAWMVPRHVHLREALPLTANGKLDRAALRPDAQTGPVAADDALTARIGEMVARVIGHPVHPQQNLFDCGATSLHIVSLQRKLAEELGSRLAVVDLFRLPSVAALAAELVGASGPDAIDAGLARAARRRQLQSSR